MNTNDDPKDICCICGSVADAGTMQDVNEVDFEILCDNCKDCRCTNCDFLRSKMKFNDERFFCRNRGCIENPKKKVCDHWEKRTENYSSSSTIKDYLKTE